MFDVKQTHIEQIKDGGYERWSILNPDGSRFMFKTFKNKGAATRERNFLLASDSNEFKPVNKRQP